MADSRILFADGEPTPENISNLVKIGPPMLTKFEKARILGTRALQISMGAPVLTEMDEDTDMSDPLFIATIEIERRVLPISVRRVLPDGRYQDIPFRWLTMKSRERKTDKRRKPN